MLRTGTLALAALYAGRGFLSSRPPAIVITCLRLHHRAAGVDNDAIQWSRGFWPHCRRLHQPNASDRGLLHAEADFIPHRPDSRSPAFL